MTPVKTTTTKKETKPAIKPSRYFEGLGGRKSAMARVRLFTKKGDTTINDKSVDQYFKTIRQRMSAVSPLVTMNASDTMYFTAHVYGGGLSAQSEAVRHGLSRALVKFNEEYRKRLRKAGFLTRDARKVERKKYGLKKASKGPQWAKR